MAQQYQHGGWYDGKQWNAETQSFGAPNQITVGDSAGKQVSSEVRSQSAAQQGVSLQQFDQYIGAQQLQSGATPSYTSGAQNSYISGLTGEVEKARKALEDSLKKQKVENDAKLTVLKTKEQDTLKEVDTLTTPFREDLENTERERLHINKNFEDNQKLVDELDTLLTEGNNLIKQQSEVTGLSAIRNPRIQKTMDDVAGRVGVIEAVINARNGQIAVAENMIDRSIGAIAADRQDRISYYSTVLELNNRDILSLDADNKQIATEQVNLLKNDLDRANATADYVKKLMIDPATAQLMGEAGVSLNDSVETINTKLQNAQYAREVKEYSNKITLAGGQAVFDPSTVPASQLRSFTDSKGQIHYYQMPVEAGSGSSKSMQIANLKQDARSGMTLRQVFDKYAGSVDPNDIYQTYNATSKYGPDSGKNTQLLSSLGVTVKADTTNSVSKANINAAKQLIIQNGGTNEDAKRAESDPDFVNWVIATYK